MELQAFFGSSNTNNIDAEEKRYVGQADFAGYRTKYFGLFFVPQKSDLIEITKYPTPLRAGVNVNITQDINLEKTSFISGPLTILALKISALVSKKKF